MDPDTLARMHAAIDRRAGVQITIVPMASGGYLAPGADQARQSVTVAAYYSSVPHSVRTESSAANSGHNAQLRSAVKAVKYQTSLVPYKVVEGDQVVLPDGSTFRVGMLFPFGTDRTVAFLEAIV